MCKYRCVNRYRYLGVSVYLGVCVGIYVGVYIGVCVGVSSGCVYLGVAVRYVQVYIWGV